MTRPVIEHWLVTVARAAGMKGAETFHMDSDTLPADAWALVTQATGAAAEEMASKVATHFRLDMANLDDRDPHAEKLLPAAFARRLNVVPLRYTDRTLTIASADPFGMEAEREITALAGRTVHPEVTFPDAIKAALDLVYPEHTGQVQEAAPTKPEGQGGPHVLVVDDDDDARTLLRSALEGRGFRVSEAADGTDALVALNQTDDVIHLVTLDLQMRELHGLDTLRKMRRTLGIAHIPVIIATGSDDPRVEMELFAAGADDYVVKPIDPPRFVLRVQAVLRRRGGVRAAISL